MVNERSPTPIPASSRRFILGEKPSGETAVALENRQDFDRLLPDAVDDPVRLPEDLAHLVAPQLWNDAPGEGGGLRWLTWVRASGTASSFRP